MLGSIAQLVQSVCLTSRGSGVRLPLLPLRKHFGISGVLFLWPGPAGTSTLHRLVRTKTAQRKNVFCAHHFQNSPCRAQIVRFCSRENPPGSSNQNFTPPTMDFRRSMVSWYQINVLNGTKCTFKATWYRLKRFRGTESQIATSAVISH